MKEQDAKDLAVKIQEEAPTATVKVVKDGFGNYCVDVAGEVQFKFIVKSDEQWQERKPYILG